MNDPKDKNDDLDTQRPAVNYIAVTDHEQPAQDRKEIMKEVLTSIDWFDQGDPLHRRRRMSSYGAMYFRSLLAFLLSINWTPTQHHQDGTTFLELYVCYLYCFGLKSRDQCGPKMPGFPLSFLFF